MTTSVRFALHIPAEQVIAYYQGVAKQVSVVTYSGQRIEFPAEKLRPFITQQGVYGEFEMEFDSQHRFVGMQRLK